MEVVVSSARRRRGIKEVNKVWKWVVVEEEEDASVLQGNHLLAKFSGMQILAIRAWNTVSSSDMNPNNINSAFIHTIKWYDQAHPEYIQLYMYVCVCVCVCVCVYIYACNRERKRVESTGDLLWSSVRLDREASGSFSWDTARERERESFII